MASTIPFGNQHRIVGRQREQAQLRTCLDIALDGQGSLVLVSGEAGIGKTMLVRDLIGQAEQQGCLVLTGGCYDLTTTPPYGPWVEITRAYPASDASLPEAPGQLRQGSGMAGIGSQAALFELVHDFFAEVSRQRPLLLVLEDLHWSDPASLDLLRYLARQFAGLPLLLVVTYRDDELTRRHPLSRLIPALVRETDAIRVDLNRLHDTDIRAMVSAQYGLPEAHEARLVAYLQRTAEGNPLFTAELLRSLESDGVLWRMEDGWSLADLNPVQVPPLVLQVIERRLAHLDEETRTALEIAAIIGQEVTHDLWRTVSNLDEEVLDRAVGQALDAHLLEETVNRAGLRFSHALVREALYTSVIPTRRRIRHRQVGEALARLPGADPDAVAYHFQEAGDSRAVEWLIRAGLRAERRYALIMAAGHFEAAQALLEGASTHEQERGWLLLRIGWLLRWSSHEKGHAYLQEAGKLAAAVKDRVLAAYSLCASGLLQPGAGDGVFRGLAEFEAGVAAINALSPADQARTETPLAQLFPNAFAADGASLSAGGLPMPGRMLGANYFNQWLVSTFAICGRYREAIVLGERHIAQATAATSDEALVQANCAQAYIGLGTACWALGQPDVARHWLTLARTAGTTLADHKLLPMVLLEEIYLTITYRTEQLVERRDLSTQANQAAHYAIDAHAIERTRNAGYHVPVAIIEGRWGEAGEILSGSRDWVWARQLLGRLAYAQGQFADAWDLVRQTLPHGPETEPGEHWFYYAIDVQRLAVQLALDARDLALARQWLEAHDRWLDWSGTVPGRSERQLLWARYHRLAGDLDQANQHAARALEQASAPRQPLALIAAHRFLGRCDSEAGRYTEAADHLRASLELAEKCEAPFEQALTILERAELNLVTGKPDEAWKQLGQVRAICTPLQALPALQRATAIAARLSVRRGQPVHPAGLTPREVEVLQHVARGMTNAEAGDVLFISSRTVAQHLRSIYNKLGVDSRVEATRFAVENGLVNSLST